MFVILIYFNASSIFRVKVGAARMLSGYTNRLQGRWSLRLTRGEEEMGTDRGNGSSYLLSHNGTWGWMKFFVHPGIPDHKMCQKLLTWTSKNEIWSCKGSRTFFALSIHEFSFKSWMNNWKTSEVISGKQWKTILLLNQQHDKNEIRFQYISQKSTFRNKVHELWGFYYVSFWRKHLH
jgi:hypothetical protein